MVGRGDLWLSEKRLREERERTVSLRARVEKLYEIAIKHLESHRRLLTKLQLAGDELHYDASDFAEQSRGLTNSLALWDAIRGKDR